MFCALPFPPLSVGSGATYFVLEVWPARQAKNAAAACSRSSALLNLRRGCFGGGTATDVAPLMSSTPRRRIRLRCFIRDQFVRPDITHFHATCALHSKAAGENNGKAGGFALAPQTSSDIVGAVGPGGVGDALVHQKSRKNRGRPAERGNYTPALRGLVQIGLMAAKEGAVSRRLLSRRSARLSCSLRRATRPGFGDRPRVFSFRDCRAYLLRRETLYAASAGGGAHGCAPREWCTAPPVLAPLLL